MKKQLIDQALLCGDDRNATTVAVYPPPPPTAECIPSDLDYDYDYELTSLLAVVSLSWKVTLKLYI